VNFHILNCGDPILSAELFLSVVVRRLKALKGQIYGVVVGDLDSIRNHLDPASIRRALPVLISIAHNAGISVLLYETSVSDVQPASIHLADTVLAITGIGPRREILARTRRESGVTSVMIPGF